VREFGFGLEMSVCCEWERLRRVMGSECVLNVGMIVAGLGNECVLCVGEFAAGLGE